MEKGHPAFKDWERRSTTVAAGPQAVFLNSTGRCNLTCFMCFHSLIDEVPVSMSVERVEPFLKDAEQVVLAGGEPFFLSTDANAAGAEIFNHIVTHYPRIRMNAFTNGTLLNEHYAGIVLDASIRSTSLWTRLIRPFMHTCGASRCCPPF